MNGFHISLYIMAYKTAKTYTVQLVKKFGSVEAVAKQLSVSPRYIYMLLKKERKASIHLIKWMKMLLEVKHDT